MNEQEDRTHKSHDNIVPEDEMARRRRVLELADDVADLCRDIGDRTKEFGDLGLKTPEWMDLVASRFSERTQDALEKIFVGLPTAWEVMVKWLDGATVTDILVDAGVAVGGVVGAAMLRRDPGDEPVERTRVRNIGAVLDRLFDEAPKLEDASGRPMDGQAPALECHVLLRGSATDLYGTLSLTPEGTLKMMTPAKIRSGPGEPERTILCEQFFDLSDVMSVMVQREVKATPGSRIITS